MYRSTGAWKIFKLNLEPTYQNISLLIQEVKNVVYVFPCYHYIIVANTY